MALPYFHKGLMQPREPGEGPKIRPARAGTSTLSDSCPSQSMSTVWAGLHTLPVSEGRLAASASDDEDGECEQDDGGEQVAVGGLDSRASNELTRELLADEG